MSARTASKALRSSVKQLTRPAVQQRTFTAAALGATRTNAVRQAPKVVSAQQTRGVKTIDFAGTKEKVFGKSPNSVTALPLLRKPPEA